MLKNNKGIKIDLIRVEGNQKENTLDLVAIESKLTIFVNQIKVATLICSPGNYKYLGIGFLFATGILQKKEDLVSIKIAQKTINVEIKSIGLPINKIIGPDMLIGIQPQIQKQNKPVPVIFSSLTISPPAIYSLISKMQEKAVFFKQSGAVHSCALADTNGSIVLFSEDISRYNTIDSILGEALLKDISTDDKIMLTSCRITSGIIKKIINGNVPIVISRSAPTDYAIRLAQQEGMTLVGFARGERMNIYSNPGRIEL